MKNLLAPASLVLLALTSCHIPVLDPSVPLSTGSLGLRTPVPMRPEGPIEGLRTYGAPIKVSGHPVWLSPFVITRPRSIFRDSDPFAEGGTAVQGDSYDDGTEGAWLAMNDVRWQNALFVDRDSGEQWNLLDRRAYVSRWWLVVTQGEGEPVSERMIFAVTVDDTEKDQDLDDQDACVALMTDGAGRDPVVVTPPEAQLAAVRLHAGGRYLSFELRFDEDGDGEFEGDEPVREWYLDLDAGDRVAKPWNRPEAEARLEELYR